MHISAYMYVRTYTEIRYIAHSVRMYAYMCDLAYRGILFVGPRK